MTFLYFFFNFVYSFYFFRTFLWSNRCGLTHGFLTDQILCLWYAPGVTTHFDIFMISFGYHRAWRAASHFFDVFDRISSLKFNRSLPDHPITIFFLQRQTACVYMSHIIRERIDLERGAIDTTVPWVWILATWTKIFKYILRKKELKKKFYIFFVDFKIKSIFAFFDFFFFYFWTEREQNHIFSRNMPLDDVFGSYREQKTSSRERAER